MKTTFSNFQMFFFFWFLLNYTDFVLKISHTKPSKYDSTFGTKISICLLRLLIGTSIFNYWVLILYHVQWSVTEMCHLMFTWYLHWEIVHSSLLKGTLLTLGFCIIYLLPYSVCNPEGLRSIWIGNIQPTVAEKELRDLFGA